MNGDPWAALDDRAALVAGPALDEPADDGMPADDGVPADELRALREAHQAVGRPYDAHEAWALRVAEQARELRLRDDARALYARQRAAEAPAVAHDRGTLADMLERPHVEAYRVDGLIPADGNTVIVAQRKTGKTTVCNNLARALITGRDFLGAFAVDAIRGRVAVLNFEVSGHTLARWAAETGVPHDRMILVNLRGKRNPFAHPDDRAELAAWLRERDVESVIVDPFGRAYTGESQNDAGEVQRFLVGLDTFARSEVGARDLIVTVHAGWNGERARGSSALEDWADVIITMTRDEDSGRRYLRAEGRDVHLDEDELTFDPATRRLSLAGTGGRRKAAEGRRHAELLRAIVPIIAANPGATGSQVSEALKAAGVPFRKGDEIKAMRAAVESGDLTVTPGIRGARHHYLPPRPPTSPRGTSATSPHLPIGRGEVAGEVTGDVKPATTPRRRRKEEA